MLSRIGGTWIVSMYLNPKIWLFHRKSFCINVGLTVIICTLGNLLYVFYFRLNQES